MDVAALLLVPFDIAGMIFLFRYDPNFIRALRFEIAPWQP